MTDESHIGLPPRIRAIIDTAAARKGKLPEQPLYDHLQPNKTYGQLELQSQQLIDAVIYTTEVGRILYNGRQVIKDHRAGYAWSQPKLVEYLRRTYARDIQALKPQYFNWREDGSKMIQSCLIVQQQFPMEQKAQLKDLVNLLTNLPYPQVDRLPDNLGRG